MQIDELNESISDKFSDFGEIENDESNLLNEISFDSDSSNESE